MTPVVTRPTILLIPGAWFPPSVYDAFLHAVRNAGYQTECASLPSLRGPKACRRCSGHLIRGQELSGPTH